jgi:acyl carrier protein
MARRFASLIEEIPVGQASKDGQSVRQTLLQAKAEERQQIVQAYLRDQVAKVLGTSPAKLDLDRPFNEIGLDSLMAVELKNRLESELAMTLPVSEMTRGPTIEKLTAIVLAELGDGTAAPSTVRDQKLLQQVEELSDEEVDRLLKEVTPEGGNAVPSETRE